VADDRSLREAARPTADEMLDRVRRQAGAGARGRHRIYLGMAPGVGKTVAALNELRRRGERGADVVVGFVETYNRPYTVSAIGDLEVVPRRTIPYKGVLLEELDTEAVIKRHPAVTLVDELAHTNAPGSRHDKRWQDVEDLLDAGITVVSTLNVQHLESLADIVESITGIEVRERIPDRVVDDADEIELVDMSPHALRQRMRHGNVYPPERAEQALRRYFREGNLTALRELALRKLSTAVEQDLEEYMREHEVDRVWPAGERVMVCLDDQPHSRTLLRRGLRRAQRQQSALLAVFIETPGWAHAGPEQKQRLEENVRLAEDLGAQVLRVQDSDVAGALVRVAREQNVDSLLIGHSRHGRLHELIRGSIVQSLLRLARDVDVHVVAERERQA
jgi:two-component system, OmpR family, sensor histidine kinase KdpD